MCRAEVGVGLGQRVLHPPALERAGRVPQHGGGGDLAVAAVGRDAALVDVVAEVEHQVEVLVGHVPVRRVVAAGPVLAGGDREVETSHPRPEGGGGARTAGVRHVPAVAEPVEPLAVGLQPLDVDVHRVGELGQRPHRAPADDVTQMRCRCRSPTAPAPVVAASRRRARTASAPAGSTAPRRRGGVATGDAQLERVVATLRPGPGRGRADRELCGGGQPGHPADGGEEAAAVEGGDAAHVGHGGSLPRTGVRHASQPGTGHPRR